MHEAMMHNNNCFITLTYNDENIPPQGSLRKMDFQKFFKRLRQHLVRENCKIPLRYYQCGEYGEKLGRPHYHAIIFGYDFPDKYVWCTRNNYKFYRSQLLEKLWQYGHSLIGDATYDTSAYVARYVTKKITGDKSSNHYNGKLPEYNTMSRRRGLGYSFIQKYMSDVYPHDYIPMKGNFVLRPPKYYDNLYDLTNPEMFLKIKEKRKQKVQSQKLDHVKRQYNAQYKQLVTKDLKRGVEDGSSNVYDL